MGQRIHHSSDQCDGAITVLGKDEKISVRKSKYGVDTTTHDGLAKKRIGYDSTVTKSKSNPNYHRRQSAFLEHQFTTTIIIQPQNEFHITKTQRWTWSWEQSTYPQEEQGENRSQSRIAS